MCEDTNMGYQDFVIKDGEFIGDFEGMYQTFKDPWNQSADESVFDSRRILALSWCTRLRTQFGSTRVIELGSGFGHLTESLRQDGFNPLVSISPKRQSNAPKSFIRKPFFSRELSKISSP